MKIKIIITTEYEIDLQYYPKNIIPEKMLDIDLLTAENDPAGFVNISKKYFNSICKITGELI